MNLKRCDQCLLVCLILAAFLTDLVSCQKNSTKSKPRDKSSKKGKETKESAPYYSFAAWNNRGKICLLVKLDATFKITYEASYGEQVSVFQSMRNLMTYLAPNIKFKLILID